MITIFHLIAFFGAVVGLAVGCVIGDKFYGTFGGLAGAVFGAYVGLVVGRLPGFFTKRALIKKVQSKSTAELQEILRGNHFDLFFFAMAELAVRGEDIQKERGRVLRLLVLDDYAARECGWRTLRHFFPEVASQIAEYQPKDSVEVCRTKTHGLAG